MDVQLKPKHLNLLESGPIQLFKFNRPGITFGQLVRLFKILSVKKLRRFKLAIEKMTYKNKPTSTELKELNSSFSSFIMN